MGTSYQKGYGAKPKGFKGQLATNQPSATLNGVAAEIVKVGVFVKVSNGQLSNLAATGDTVDSLVVKSDFITDIHQANDSLTRAKKGPYFVYCETDIQEGASLFIRHTANGALEVGDVRKDLDTNKADENTKVTALETLTTAGILTVQIDL